MSILNGRQLIWLTTFLFLAILDVAAQSAAPLPSDVALPRSPGHEIVPNANHLTYKLMVFRHSVRLCRKLLNGLAGQCDASGQSGVDREFHGLDGEVH